MSERATGITVRNPNEYVATQLASEQADGHDRVIQIISVAAGKIDENNNSGSRTVSVDDSYDVSTVSGSILVGDNSYMSCYARYTGVAGSCLITPLLCNSAGVPIGCLTSKKSMVGIPVVSGSHYLANCLVWNIKETGAYYVYPHVVNITNTSEVEIKCYIF